MQRKHNRSLRHYSLFFISLLAVYAAPNSRATEVYQCEKNGTKQFAQTACPSDALQQGPVKVSVSTPSADEQRAAVLRQKKAQDTLNQLQHAREKEEEKQAKVATKLANKYQQHKAVCDQAQLHAKWAQEDMREATEKTAAKAKIRSRREKEKADLICK